MWIVLRSDINQIGMFSFIKSDLKFIIKMTEELERILQDKYAFMHRDSEGIYDMYGCQCEDGWYDLIDQTCSRIQAIYDEMGIESNLMILQIKEKFGTLRYYFDLPVQDEKLRRKITRIVDEARARSAQICEQCGNRGKMRVADYYQVLCDDCFNRLQKMSIEEIPNVPVSTYCTEAFDKEDPEEVFTKQAMRSGRVTLEDYLKYDKDDRTADKADQN